jgi:probable rRNA maturation factor
MNNKVEIFVQVDEEIKELETVEKVLYSALEKEKLNNTSFNVIIVDNDYIHELNKNYRNIDRETDVITFALEDEDTLVLPGEERILGDIYISIEKARSQAEEYGHSLLRELSFLAVHGFYHLLGYDHQTPEEEKVMFGRQEEVLDAYGIRRES